MGKSFCSDWYLAKALGILLIDEAPRLAFGEVAGLVIGFEMVVLAGDRNQFRSEQRQSCLGAKLSITHSSKGSQPLNRHTATDWVEALARRSSMTATSEFRMSQYRSSGDTIRLMKHIFRDACETLAGPDDYRNTLTIPYFFRSLTGEEEWTYSRNTESLRNSTVFAHCLAVVAMEIVLGHARPHRAGRCQILLMWYLRITLIELQTFLEACVTAACRSLHSLWRIEEPEEGYDRAYSLTEWMQAQRFQYKPAQNAHGTHT